MFFNVVVDYWSAWLWVKVCILGEWWLSGVVVRVDQVRRFWVLAFIPGWQMCMNTLRSVV